MNNFIILTFVRFLFLLIVLLLVYGFVYIMDRIGFSRSLSGFIIFLIFFILVKLNGGRRL